MNVKGQTGLTGLFLTIITVSAFTLFALLFIGGGADFYSVSYNNTEFEQFDKSVEAASLAIDTEQTITGANQSGTVGSNTNIDIITTSAFKTFPIIANTPVILNSMFVGVGNILGIPSTIVTLIFSFITLLIIAIFILLIFRVNIM